MRLKTIKWKDEAGMYDRAQTRFFLKDKLHMDISMCDLWSKQWEFSYDENGQPSKA